MASTQDMNRPTGAVSRRAAITAAGAVGLGAVGAAGAAAASSGPNPDPGPKPHPTQPHPTGPAACTLVPEQTEGPYYLPLELVRRDITEGYAGLPLILRTTVIDAVSCRPIPNAAVDIWHCSAVGVYSGYTQSGSGGAGGAPPSGAPPSGAPGPAPSGSGAPGGPGHQPPTDNLTFLRGVQLTNRRGVAEFATIYPGWYQGRAIHIHVKVHIGGSIAAGAYTGGHVSHTGQFYFDEGVTERVAKLAPYNTNTATRITNAQDFIYANGGSAGLLALAPLRHDHPPVPGGMVGTITVAVNPAATPAPV